MKAIRLHRKGGPEALLFEDAPLPVLLEGDALVKVLASGITRDELIWGPTYADEKGNSRLPTIPGHELCGVVEAVASDVNNIRPGDSVYGLASFFRNGTAAEYIAVRAADLAPKPKTMDAIQAASVPLSALTAWQALFDHAELRPGQRILIHGGAGGVGIFAIQFAHWRGAHVITTASAENELLLKGLGASEIIDYSTKRFEDEVSNIDVVLDCIGGDTQERSWQLLNRGGVLVTIAGESVEQPAPDLGVKGIFFIVKANRAQLIEIGNLIDQGLIRTVIANIFPLEQARTAFEQTAASGKQGKIVLRVG